MTSEELISVLTEELKNQRYLTHFSSDYLSEQIRTVLSANGELRKALEALPLHSLSSHQLRKNPTIKHVLKLTKQRIGTFYTSYLTAKFHKRTAMLELPFEESTALLSLHKSTHERESHYAELYEALVCWHQPTGIVDIGCGLNPCSHPYLLAQLTYSPSYLAIELAKEDVAFLNTYFSTYQLPGEAKAMDLSSEHIPELPKTIDTAFLFKFVDVLEQFQRHRSKTLLRELKTPYLVVSFAIQSVGNRQPFRNTQRGWFHKFLREERWNYHSCIIGDELFFFITKPGIH